LSFSGAVGNTKPAGRFGPFWRAGKVAASAAGSARIPVSQAGNGIQTGRSEKEEFVMDSVTIIRIVAGVLFVAVLVLLIQRRRTRVK